MKRLIRLFCLIAAATALGSCARDKVIPDEELARIFRDAYLINAYVSDRLLEEESAYYKYEVGVLDTIDNVARRRFTRTVYSDSLIRVTRIKDTARLRVRIPDTRPGEYRVSFDYLIDSLDENLAPRMRVWLVEADSSRKGESSSILRKSSRERVSRILQADSSARSLPVRDPRKVQASRRDDIRPESILYARNRRGRGQPLHRPVGS